MRYTKFAMDFLEKIEEDYILCVGFGDNPYVGYLESEHDENKDVYIELERTGHQNKTILITKKKIKDLENQYETPIFLSRVVEHFKDYIETVQILSKIASKMYVVVPDMAEICRYYLSGTLTKMEIDRCFSWDFIRSTIEILSEGSDVDGAMHSLWTDETSMKEIFSSDNFKTTLTDKIKDIDGFPHLVYTIDVLHKMDIMNNEVEDIFNPHVFEMHVVDLNSSYINKINFNTTKCCFEDMESTYPFSTEESVVVIKHSLLKQKTREYDYFLFQLSNIFPKGTTICFVENDCYQIVKDLSNGVYVNIDYFTQLNNLLFGDNEEKIYRSGWTCPISLRTALEQEGLYEVVSDFSTIENKAKKQFLEIFYEKHNMLYQCVMIANTI